MNVFSINISSAGKYMQKTKVHKSVAHKVVDKNYSTSNFEVLCFFFQNILRFCAFLLQNILRFLQNDIFLRL